MSEAADLWDGSIEFTQFTRPIKASANPTKSLYPGDPGYFQEYLAELLARCNQPGISICGIDPATLRMIDFDGNHRILKVGIWTQTEQSEHWDGYSYYSVAVRDGMAFRARASIQWPKGGAALIPCAIEPGSAACANPAAARTQLSNLVAAHLTTFGNLSHLPGGGGVETQFVYDSSADDPSTIHVAYYENGNPRFYNSRGKIWMWDESTRFQYEMIEYARNTDYVYLADCAEVESCITGRQFAIPIAGGTYGVSADRGQTWSPAGDLQRIE